MLSKSPQMIPQSELIPAKAKEQAGFGGKRVGGQTFLQKHKSNAMAMTRSQPNTKKKAKVAKNQGAPVHISKSHFNAVMNFVSERRRRGTKDAR